MSIFRIADNCCDSSNEDKRQMDKFIKLALVIFLILFGLFAMLNQYVRVDTDAAFYLEFASSLAKGNYYLNYLPEQILLDCLPKDELHLGFYSHIIKHGKSLSHVAIGYPIFLSMFIALGGIFAPFLANVVVFIALFAVIYLFTKLVFRNSEYSDYISLVTVLLYFYIHRNDIVRFLSCYRDPLSYLLMLGGFCFYLKFLNCQQRRRNLILTAFLIGLSCTVRETSIFCLIPMSILYITKYVRKKQLAFLKNASIFIIFFSIGISPLLGQNYVNSGDLFYPTQSLRDDIKFSKAGHDNMTLQRNYSAAGMGSKYFSKTSEEIGSNLWKDYEIFFAIFFLLGLALGRKSDEIKYFLVPFIVIYFVFYSFYYTRHWRYIFVIYMAIVPTIAFGLIEPLSRVFRKRYLSIGLLIFFCFVIYDMFSEIPQNHFQIEQARHFKKDFERIVPASSVVIAERHMRKVIDYFTNSYCIRPNDFLRYKHRIDVRTGLDYFLGNFKNVYFFDNVDLDPWHKYNHTPVMRQRILGHFNLVPITNFDGQIYNLTRLFGRKSCTLSRIKNWEKKLTVQSLTIPEIQDSILQINCRKLWSNNYERNWVKLYFNDYLLSNSITDGINYFYIPTEMFYGSQKVKLISDAPLPNDVDPKIFSIHEDILVDIEASSVPIVKKSRIRIPTIRYPDTTLLVLGRMSFRSREEKPAEANVSFSINGYRETVMKISDCNGWQTISFPLQDKNINKVMSEITIDISGLEKTSEHEDPSPYLSIDSFTIHRYNHNTELPIIDIGGNDDFYIRYGFYDKEKHLGKHTVRWTQSNAEINLPDFNYGEDLLLEIQVWGLPDAVKGRVSNVYINSNKVGELKINESQGKRQSFWIKVPRRMLLIGFNKLKIESDVWTPSEVLGSADARRLGLMIDAIRLHYFD